MNRANWKGRNREFDVFFQVCRGREILEGSRSIQLSYGGVILLFMSAYDPSS
jgi:hypothetical protein